LSVAQIIYVKAYINQKLARCSIGRDVNKDLTPKDQDKDKDLIPRTRTRTRT